MTSVSTSVSRAPAAAAPSAATPSAQTWLVQRKCACGGTTDASGECEACRKKRLQRAGLPASPSPAPGGKVPASVHAALSESGAPLDRSTRAFFERRLGHDFSRVRVHAGSTASASAAAINAQAYTVGRDVVFGAGYYRPSSPEGRRLLAHELTHVVQQARGAGQSGQVQASSISPERRMRIGPENDELEREAESVAAGVSGNGGVMASGVSEQRIQRAPVGPRRPPAIVGLDESGPNADLTGKTEDSLYACMKDAQPDPDACTPNRALTWSDFAGPARANQFGAETHTKITDKPMDPVKAGCLQRILGKSKDETRLFQAVFDSTKSWARAIAKNPTNTRLTGCRNDVPACTQFFAAEARAKRTGGQFKTEGQPSPDCPASAVAGTTVASSAADCVNIETECTRTAVAESQRLLAHEQGHFNITCVIAGKATSALMAGGDLATIKTAAGTRLTETQQAYDDETGHGCDAGSQASWESDITNRLPKVNVP